MTKLTDFVRQLKAAVNDMTDNYIKASQYYDEALTLVVDRDQTIAELKSDLANTNAELSIKKLDVHKMNRTIQQLRNANQQTILDLKRQIMDRDSWLKEAHQQTDANAAIIDELESRIKTLENDLERVHDACDHWQWEADVASKAIKGYKTKVAEMEQEIEDLKANPVKKCTLTLLFFGSVYGTFPITYRTTAQVTDIANNILKQNPHNWTLARLILDNEILEREPGPDQPWTTK